MRYTVYEQLKSERYNKTKDVCDIFNEERGKGPGEGPKDRCQSAKPKRRQRKVLALVLVVLVDQVEL